MRIQHNIMAMNAYRNYTNNTSALSKNLEKLSSGYRINRAGDDAAGLAISEKMRAQITALGTAQKNVKDGISLVKTAEGATQEIHDMLNRMVDLATQSSNGTYQDEVDREAIESEFNALKTEINRIADASNFNGIKLLDGSLDGTGKVTFDKEATMTAVHDGLRGSTQPNGGEYSLDLAGLELRLGATAAASLSAGDNAFTISVAGKTVATINMVISKGEKVVITTGDIKLASSATIGGMTFAIELDGTKITLKGTKGTPTAAEETTFNGTGLDVTVTPLNADVTNNNGWDQSVHTVKKLAAGVDDKLAHGSFDLAEAELKDGSVIKIGDETYSFKIGKDGKGASADHEIDLSDVAADDADLAKKAAIALAKQNSNKLFDISAPNDDSTVHLNEKKGALKDYSEWDLQGTAGTDPDATWKNLNTKKAVVQFGTVGEASGKALTLQIGEDSEKYNQLSVNIKDMHVAALGLDSHTLKTQEGAQSAVSAIKDAINYVSTVRSDLGATQNRLEHTANNLSTMKENIQDAESTIRDTDIAEEMMAYTKNNILVQSAQAMLAQANQIPQGVLQLLG